MAHALFLDVGLVVVLPVRLQHVLNDEGIGGDNCLPGTAKIEPESVPIKRGVFGENPNGIVRHCARIQKGAGSGHGRNSLPHAHASLSPLTRVRKDTSSPLPNCFRSSKWCLMAWVIVGCCR